MRSLYFTAAESGMTRAQLRHGEAKGSWIRLGRGNYRLDLTLSRNSMSASRLSRQQTRWRADAWRECSMDSMGLLWPDRR